MDNQTLTDCIRVSKYLNKPRIILGMTIDEFLPAFIVLFIGVMSAYLASSLVFCMIWVMGLKTMKRYRSPQFMRICLYWFFNKQLGVLAFKETLPSAQTFWLR